VRKRLGGNLGWLSLTAALLVGLVAVGVRRLPAAAEEAQVGFTEVVQIAEDGGATAVRVDHERVAVKKATGAWIVAIVADERARHELVDRFAQAHVPVEFTSREPSDASRLLAAGGPLFAIAILGAGALLIQRRRGHGHFSLGGATVTAPVRFSDVAGMDDVKEALQETVTFLRDPPRFGRLGGRAPRGVLLTGDPGTGKTLLARAVSSEAGVPFLSCSGSNFQEMYVGVGAARVRSLFKEARRLAPCIVFIDEIDAVGRARGKGGDSALTDHHQTINQLLVEMDGFDPSLGIVVMASTNRPDVLDAALLRPGRFDRQVAVPLPDLRGRTEILRVHARPIDLHHEVDLAHVARQTPGFSGAELANLLNEAAILAARDNASAVEADHLERARDRVLMGLERNGVLLDPDERHATAVHEAGHVAVGMAAAHTDPLHKVSILPRGRALGVTASVPERDRLMYKKEYLEDQICLMLGGRAAELEILGTMTAGASDDIERATNLARKMVAELGMSDLGPICLKGDAELPHSQKLLDTVEETTRSILNAQLERARGIVGARRAEIDALVEGLLDRDTLSRSEILACFPGDQKQLAAPPGLGPARASTPHAPGTPHPTPPTARR
jgi:cell division protease FtsH